MDKYGLARIIVCYDLEVEERKTNPSEIEKKVYNIKQQSYFVAKGTDIILPSYAGVSDEDDWSDKEIGFRGHNSSKGTLTLFYELLNTFKEIGDEYPEGTQSISFDFKVLEKRLEDAKLKLVDGIKSHGINADTDKVYFELVAGIGFN